MSLLEQNITRRMWVEKVPELDASNEGSEKYEGSKKYKVEAIWDSAVYIRESESHLPRLYYLVA